MSDSSDGSESQTSLDEDDFLGEIVKNRQNKDDEIVSNLRSGRAMGSRLIYH